MGRNSGSSSVGALVTALLISSFKSKSLPKSIPIHTLTRLCRVRYALQSVIDINIDLNFDTVNTFCDNKI